MDLEVFEKGFCIRLVVSEGVLHRSVERLLSFPIETDRCQLVYGVNLDPLCNLLYRVKISGKNSFSLS